jgi:RNA polymerase sigma-70 factor (ECF subfamily)
MSEQEAREQGFVGLYERHYAAVLAYARRRVDEPTARDITAETFLVAWRRLEEAQSRGLPWLYSTAAFVLKNAQRSAQRRDQLTDRLAALPVHAGEDHAQSVAERELLFAAMRGLSEADRELLLLVVWEQLDTYTAARIVGCSPKTAAVRLYRARRRLQALLPPPGTSAATGPIAVPAKSDPNGSTCSRSTPFPVETSEVPR